MTKPDSQARANFHSQIIIILLGMIALRLWMIPAEILPAAQAQIIDAGTQRQQIIAELKSANQTLGQILSHLEEKPVKVLILEPQATDNTGKTPPPKH